MPCVKQRSKPSLLLKYLAFNDRKPPLSYCISGGRFMIYLKNRFNMEFSTREASSVAIIGGADGPTAIFLTNSHHIRLDVRQTHPHDNLGFLPLRIYRQWSSSSDYSGDDRSPRPVQLPARAR